MDTSVGRSTEARGLPHAFPTYDSRDTLAWLCQNTCCRPDQPSLCSGYHRQETKFIVRQRGETRWPHASPPRIITGCSSKNRPRFDPDWRRRPGRPRHSWIQQIGDGTPYSIRAESFKAGRRGHSGLTQRTSAVYAIWWWWWWWYKRVPNSSKGSHDPSHASYEANFFYQQTKSIFAHKLLIMLLWIFKCYWGTPILNIGHVTPTTPTLWVNLLCVGWYILYSMRAPNMK